MQACGYVGKFKVCGVLGVEHFGKQSDGFCLTLLLQAQSKPGKGSASGKGSLFRWTAVIDTAIAQRLQDTCLIDFGCAVFDN